MCGRTACTLSPQQLCKACKASEGRRFVGEPQWREPPGEGTSYRPRFNFGPSVYNPVLLPGSQFSATTNSQNPPETETEPNDISYKETDLVIQPMRWGLIPSFHKGAPKEFRFKTINARSDGLTSKPIFRTPLSKGRRCVVLADGYYEWQTTAGPDKKQPYFIYFPQDTRDVEWDHPEKENGEDEWTGRRVMTMAGLFDINHQNDETLYSYAIITVDASETLAWMHDRMPAILDGDDAVDQWLDYKNVPLTEALKLIKPVDNLCYHAVSKSVGNIQTQDSGCIVPLRDTKGTKTENSSQKTLDHYFAFHRTSKRAVEETKNEKTEQNSSSSSEDEDPSPRKMKKGSK